MFRAPKVAFNPDDYTTEQVFYTSKDGTQVPMFISYKKGLKPDGQAPTLLYGYGGFNIPLTPGFSVSNLVWMEHGRACTPCPTCAAAASTARPGTRPAPSCRSRTCSTTSSPRPSG